MSQHYLDTVVQASRTAHQPARMREQSLPFTVRVVRHEDELMKAVQIRQAAYGRHLPEFAQTLRLPETLDMKPGVAVLLAESYEQERLVGSASQVEAITANREKRIPRFQD